jgi:hypothetical protein
MTPRKSDLSLGNKMASQKICTLIRTAPSSQSKHRGQRQRSRENSRPLPCVIPGEGHLRMRYEVVIQMI